jgi:hypothetical protein
MNDSLSPPLIQQPASLTQTPIVHLAVSTRKLSRITLSDISHQESNRQDCAVYHCWPLFSARRFKLLSSHADNQWLYGRLPDEADPVVGNRGRSRLRLHHPSQPLVPPHRRPLHTAALVAWIRYGRFQGRQDLSALHLFPSRASWGIQQRRPARRENGQCTSARQCLALHCTRPDPPTHPQWHHVRRLYQLR